MITAFKQYLSPLKLGAVLKRTLASLRQFGNFLALTYSIPNPASPAVASAKAGPTNYLKHFTNYLNTQHLSPLTIKSYKSDITRYLKWNHNNDIAQVLTDKSIKKYIPFDTFIC